MADALAATVVGELPPGPVRDQVQAAVGLSRRLARALPGLTPYLQQDIQDLAATLRRLRAGQEPPVVDEGLDAAVAIADALPDAPLPDLHALAGANLRLREALTRLAEKPALNVEDDEVLRALLARMASREAALGLSPWER